MNRLWMSVPAFLMLMSGCSSHYRGVECHGDIKSLAGQPLGATSALIEDRYHSFSVAMPQEKVESGTLQSADRSLYIPSAVTTEGYLAQRLSDKKFTLIDSRQDRWITYTCP